METTTDSINIPPIAEHVLRWGGSASIALLNPACQFFANPSIDGVIGYRTESNCAVVYGDPVCTPKDMPHLAQAFQHYCQNQGWNTVYTTASKHFAQWATRNICSASLQIGEELILDPDCDPKEGSKGRKLRNKISHAQHAGVLAEEYLLIDKTLEQALEQAAAAWIQGRQGPQIYLAQVNLFAERSGKRWFYACQNGKIVGGMLCNRLNARQGWLINLLFTTPEAPLGTSEMLVVKGLETLRQENCRFVTCGVVPGKHLREVSGLNFLTTWFAKAAFKVAKSFFHLNSRKMYWEKFHPQSEPSYLLFSHARIRVREIVAVMHALNASL